MAKIIGNTTATPNPQSDWNQNDPTKADYIKNKPSLLSATIENETLVLTQSRTTYKSLITENILIIQ